MRSASPSHATLTHTAGLHAEPRTIVTPSGFRLRIPLARVQLRAIEAVRSRPKTTLTKQAERWLQQGIAVRLPVGRLTLRFYSRPLMATMVSALGRLKRYHDRHPEADYAHLNDFAGPRHGDWARLRWWGLIEAKHAEGTNKDGTPRDEMDRGWWKLTGLGHRWLRGDEKIPRASAMFDGQWVGWVDAADLVGPSDVDRDFSFDVIVGRAPVGAA
ncbi:MAG: hypothetical protein RL030_2781 [Pseudomonadota bacterium]|jgi:hypothetical protein